MKQLVLIYSSLLLSVSGFAQAKVDTTPVLQDSLTPAQTAEENEIMDEIIDAKKMPSTDKVQYFSQVTRYGFKNLFPRYSFNTNMPYTSQINSNAPGFVEGYMRSHSKYLLGMKEWGRPYFNLIENVLTQYGLPKELKYIAVIESNLQTGAVSNKGAGGPWQFMPATARQFGLVINNYTDQRTDYLKSTHAAAQYLTLLYKQLHDWLLVMAAYNGGAGRVMSAMRMSGSSNFWQLQQYLPEESRTYVKRFIATHYIMENGTGMDFGMENMNASYTGGGTRINPFELNKPALSAEEVAVLQTEKISGYYKASVIAKKLSIEPADFNRMNPNMDMLLSRTGNYELRLPPEKMEGFLSAKYEILNECVNMALQDAAPVDYNPEIRYNNRNKKLKKGKS